MEKLSEEELNEVLTRLDETEKASLRIAYNIMQKIISVVMAKPGRPQLVDVFRNVSATLSEIFETGKNNE